MKLSVSPVFMAMIALVSSIPNSYATKTSGGEASSSSSSSSTSSLSSSSNDASDSQPSVIASEAVTYVYSKEAQTRISRSIDKMLRGITGIPRPEKLSAWERKVDNCQRIAYLALDSVARNPKRFIRGCMRAAGGAAYLYSVYYLSKLAMEETEGGIPLSHALLTGVVTTCAATVALPTESSILECVSKAAPAVAATAPILASSLLMTAPSHSDLFDNRLTEPVANFVEGAANRGRAKLIKSIDDRYDRAKYGNREEVPASDPSDKTD